MIENSTLNYHNNYKIKKHLLKMLLEKGLYNSFCEKIDSRTTIFEDFNFFNIFPNRGGEHKPLDHRFLEEMRRNWVPYITDKTYSYILDAYDTLAKEMRNSGRFKGIHFNVVSPEPDAKINGIYVNEKCFFDSWYKFLEQNENSVQETFKKLPNVAGHIVSGNVMLFYIRGFNDNLTNKYNLQE